MKIEPNFIKLLKTVNKPEDVRIDLKQDVLGNWCIRWGGYSIVHLKGCNTPINLNLTEFIFVDEDEVVHFVDTDEEGKKQERGQYPLSLVSKIELGI